MRSEDIKRKKEEIEYEEADPTLFGEVVDDSEFNKKFTSFTDKYNSFKNRKWFKPIIIGGFIAIFLLIIVVYALINSNNGVGITKIDTNLPKIIYTNEELSFKTEVFGEGKLSNTVLTYRLYSGNATIKETELTGDSVNNTIIPTKVGTIYVEIDGVLDNKKVTYKSDPIAICNRLTKDAINSQTFNVKKGSTNVISLSLGSSELCYENVTYSIDNPKIATIEGNKVTGISTGSAILTIKDNTTELKVTIAVK